jgi:tetratricopeptide (TPR) repeat protein
MQLFGQKTAKPCFYITNHTGYDRFYLCYIHPYLDLHAFLGYSSIMFGFFKRLLGLNSSVDRQADPDGIIKEQWQADFSREDEPGKQPHVRFSITSENLYRAYLQNNALCLGLKKPGCIAWAENMAFRYEDLDMKGRIHLDPKGGYAAAGFIFRMVDDRTYYMVLVSNRGYFRLDLIRNGTPLYLAGWTEIPDSRAATEEILDFELELITYGSKILLLINGLWAGDWNDSSIPAGRIAFAAASYDLPEAYNGRNGGSREFTAEAALSAFSLDSRIEETEKRYNEMKDRAFPESRIRLAETYTALGQINPALVQLRKAWESRSALAAELANAEDKVILSAIHVESPEFSVRTTKELLLGARLAMALELWDETEEYIEAVLNTEEQESEARTLKAAFLYSRGRYEDLIQWTCEVLEGKAEDGTAEEPRDTAKLFADPPGLYNLLGHAYFNTGAYEKAAENYDRAFELNNKNGMSAKNAAAAYELLNQGEKALDRYLKAGRVFLGDSRYEELGLLIPKFRLLGAANWEARALSGKWAFGIENWNSAREELDLAERLRREKPADKTQSSQTRPPDPALYFLQGLILIREGKRREAMPLLEKAVKYAPDYPLFHFRLAENRFLITRNPDDPELAANLEAALKVQKDEQETYGWVHNFAAHVALSRGDLEKAKELLDNAAAILGEVPAVRVNRAVSLYLHDSLDEALEILQSKPEEDPEGLMANCAGNLLVRSRRFEEADVYYRRALTIVPENDQYRYNRASCLIETGRYGEADDVLTTGDRKSSPEILELIAFVAVKKGEYKRAEAAARAALNIDPNHAPSLLHLGWVCAFGGRWDEVEDVLDHLDEVELREELAKGRDELELWMEEALFRTVTCASCGRDWQVDRYPGPVPALRLFAIPPDDMPAGTCPGCGKTYCVGCRKDALDESDRFTCPDCGKTLKLTDDGLKSLLNEWAKKNLKKQKRDAKKAAAAAAAPETATTENVAETVAAAAPETVAASEPVAAETVAAVAPEPAPENVETEPAPETATAEPEAAAAPEPATAETETGEIQPDTMNVPEPATQPIPLEPDTQPAIQRPDFTIK